MNALTPEEFVKKHDGFDYVIIGGGTAGLVVAARLSEDPDVTVGVIEAGSYHINDPLIDIPGYFGRAIGNPAYDWAYSTTPQKHVNDRLLFQPRGKMLGGSSGLNFMTTGRASKEEYDAFEAVGNPGWNWDSLLGYFKKSENVHTADKDVHSDRHNANFDPSVHGTNGPIHKSFAPWASDLSIPFFDTLEELGVQRNRDAASGHASGSYTILSAVDPATAKRSYAASGYYAPNVNRPNLVVLPSAHVTKLILTGTGEPYTVSGVQFTVAGSDKAYEVKATREVILSAGAFGTPQLLELSGIGKREVLERVGIEVKIDLPSVGENLQDHVYVLSTYEISNKLTTLDLLRNPERHKAETQLYEQAAKGMYSCTHSAFGFLPAGVIASPSEIARMKREIHNDSNLEVNESLKKQKALLEAWLDDQKHPQIELISYPVRGLFPFYSYKRKLRASSGTFLFVSQGFFPIPGKTPRPGSHYHTVVTILMHAMSRGSVHITSASPFDKAAVDSNYLANKVDRDLLVHGVRFVKKLHDTGPLKNVTVGYVEPAWRVDAGGEDGGVSDEELGEYVKNGLEPICHPAGTAAMFPREEGGVVDPRLKVYGTTNLRVIDASVIPIHVAAHPTATILAMAEKAADIFKADARA
ncbi:GMC oxidoreductase [Clavulina sp. PMI_390]|nr:GMC oxidoreductase [Clavulina sp. PMI_390]